MSNYNRSKLQSEVNAVMASANVSAMVPVTINARITSTLGRACTMRNRITREIVSVRIEFSKRLVEKATDETVRDVLLHECAHIICAMRYNDCKHGHDHVFKAICHEIGTNCDKAHTVVEYATNEPHDRYEVICPDCGVVARYNRMCKTLKEISHYKCGKCRKPENTLSLRSNW